jgi:hypothetical protein
MYIDDQCTLYIQVLYLLPVDVYYIVDRRSYHIVST